MTSNSSENKQNVNKQSSFLDEAATFFGKKNGLAWKFQFTFGRADDSLYVSILVWRFYYLSIMPCFNK